MIKITQSENRYCFEKSKYRIITVHRCIKCDSWRLNINQEHQTVLKYKVRHCKVIEISLDFYEI